MSDDGSSGDSTSASSAADAAMIDTTTQQAAGDADVDGSEKIDRKRKLSDDTATASSATSMESSDNKKDTQSSTTNTLYDDAGSSRLFQPHRSLGLLTASSPSTNKPFHGNHQSATTLSSAKLFASHKGKFHLQPQSSYSDEAFVTIPLGDRFQIMTLGKLVPVLVSRALPPSADHHRSHAIKSKRRGGYVGGDEEEMHRAISDSSLSITVATHGPKVTGRAVSITLYSRTRPLVCLDAFPFLQSVSNKKKKSNQHKWGIVDVVPLGKQCVAMGGEKEGKMENVLLFAFVCARGDSVGKDKSDDKDKVGGVQVVGEDSSDEESGDSGDDESGSTASESDGSTSSDDDSRSDEDSTMSLDDEEKPPSKDCYGRILLVQASRLTMQILNVIDLNGVGSNFVPYVGLHPATYVNKILLGGRPAASNVGNHKKSDTSLLLVNVRSGKMIHSFNCLSGQKKSGKQQLDSAIITTLTQSPAVDTVAVGTSDGSVHLVNTLHDVKLFTLQHKSKVSSKKKKSAGRSAGSMNAVSSISFRTDGNATRQGVAPLAVGCDDGSMSVWDLTPVEDENDGTVRRTLLTQIEAAHYGGISKLEYLPGEPLLLSTGVSSNSIVLHVFDAPDHSGRILRQRKGHTSPPTLLRYLHPGLNGGGVLANSSDGTDASSCQILSCGGPGDLSLRLFSTARSNLDKEYSQGPGLEKLAKKFGKVGPSGRAELLLPEIVGLATSEARSRDWGDLVTIHRDHAMAYVWSTKRGSQNGPVLRQPQWNVSAMKNRPPRSAHATSLAISACGNFALVGSLGGVVYKYNLQSGLPRGSYPRNASSLTDEEEKRRKKGLKFAGDVGRTMRMLEKTANKGGSATTPSDIDKAEQERVSYLEAEAKRNAIISRASHSEAVVGIAIDSLNKTMVTAGADSKLVLWNFVTHMPHKKSPIALPSPATKLTHVRDSDLAAIAMVDFGVAVFDCSSLTIVRYFGGSKQSSPKDGMRMGHTSPITDLQFGPDGRKLFTSSLDGTVRVWDVPTGLCVDWMSFSSPPTSLALSPTGEYLATSHVGRLGISLWCDKSFFRMVLLDGTPTEPARMNEPCPVAECEREGADAAANDVAPSMIAKKEDDDMALTEDNEASNDGMPPQAKEEGLITLSGLPPAHWKNLFHLELVKERNKPTEAPQKPPQAPFFLQWRSGLESSGNGEDATATDGANAGGSGTLANDKSGDKEDANDGWDAVWSDDDREDDADATEGKSDELTRDEQTTPKNKNKRRKVVHHRSKLAELLQYCFDGNDSSNTQGQISYSDVTSYLSTMGPSSIDVEISSLCYGIHDLDEGLPLLHMASMWLLEACESHQSFEAVNAYLHRFLHVHGNVITRMDQSLEESEDATTNETLGKGESDNDAQKMKLKEFVETIAQLREKQKAASNRLQGKMQHTLCLLRHLSRMV